MRKSELCQASPQKWGPTRAASAWGCPGEGDSGDSGCGTLVFELLTVGSWMVCGGLSKTLCSLPRICTLSCDG